jgi:hypothetical protein
VYQMIERSTLASSTVRELTHSLADRDERRLLSRWARENVRCFARRGGLAEEYVFSVLRYGAYETGIPEDEELALVEVLNRLGMQEYLREPNEEFVIVEEDSGHKPGSDNLLMLKRTHAQKLCVAVFRKLIGIRLGSAHATVHVQDLMQELL